MRNTYLVVAALLISGGTAAAQTSNPRDRIDGEGINMDAPAPLTSEPRHPADPLTPNTSQSAGPGNDNGPGA